jgi:hypothetical protein
MKKVDPSRFGDSDEEMLRYLISLKIILSADGSHPLELHALSLGMQLMGVPEHLSATVNEYDVSQQRLEDHLPRKCSRGRARLLIYDAVRLSSADQEYSGGEQAAVARAAHLLGVDAFAVRALEGLVQMERAVDRMRKSLLQGD